MLKNLNALGLSLALTLALGVAPVQPVFGQTGTATISGTVVDASNATVPDADVTVANTSIGFERKLKTNGAGLFTAPDLRPATGYTVSVSKAGFAKYNVNAFDLEVGQSLNFNVSLQVASGGTQVSVTSEAPLVEADKTDVSGVVDQNELLNLPINGRRVDSFVLLEPGVTNDAAFGLMTFRGMAGGNTFLTDGIDTTNNFYDENAGRTRTYNISQDAVQEFQVVTSNFLPEYGRASGGVVNTITKSGTNAIHGSAYWFFRNRTLNATDPTSLGVNPPEWRHQAGLSIGGPIQKNKLFYFFNGELQRRSEPIVSSNISSTIFNADGTPGTGTNGYNNASTGCGGSSFTARATTAQCNALLTYLESRVVPQLVPRTSDVNLLFGKIDYQINDRNHFNTEFNYLDFRSPNGIQTQGVLTSGAAIGNNANTNVFDRTLKSGLTTIVASNAINELRFGMFKDRQYDPNSPTLEPVINGAPSPISFSITSGSLSNIGYATSYPRLHPSELRFQLSDTYALTIGRNQLKFGIDWAHTEDYDYSKSNQFGTFTYPNANALALDFSGNTTGAKDWSTFSQKFGNPLWDGVVQDIALFAQDEIHLTPKLTISPGLRYEHTWLPQPTAPLAFGTLNIPADWPQTGHLNYKPDNIAPRIGVAYAWDQKTVIRAGYGLFYNRYVSQIIDGLAEANGSYQPSYSLSNTVAAQLAAGPLFPSYLPAAPNVTGSASLAFTTKDFRNSYSESAQVSIQREIAKSTSLTVSYIFNRGLHIVSGYNANLSAPTQSVTYGIYSDIAGTNQVGSYTTPIYTRSNLINPNYGTVMAVNSVANSWYNGLVVSVNHRFTGWFQGVANYTWSHSEDDNLGGAGGATGSNGVLFAPSAPPTYANDNYSLEKGTAATDQRHKLILTGIVSPTFVHGSSWIEKNFINGWQLSFVSSFASSFPVNETIGGVSSSTLPTVTGPCSADTAISSPCAFFSTSTINGLGGSTRAPFLPVDALNVGPTFRTDGRIAHTWGITERLKLMLAFEAQNVFNHLIVQGASPINEQGYTLTAGKLVPFAQLGQILATQAPPDGTTARRAQASLRITW